MFSKAISVFFLVVLVLRYCRLVTDVVYDLLLVLVLVMMVPCWLFRFLRFYSSSVGVVVDDVVVVAVAAAIFFLVGLCLCGCLPVICRCCCYVC